MTERIKVDGLEALTKALNRRGNDLHVKLLRVAKQAAVFGKGEAEKLSKRAGMKPHKNSEGYLGAFEVTMTSDGAVLGNKAKHARFVELGRRAGRPPPVTVILLWMFERGLIRRIPSFKRRVSVDPAIKGTKRRIAIGEAKEAESRRRLSEREKYIAEARSKAYAIARSIGKRGVRGKFILGKTTERIAKYVRRELMALRSSKLRAR